MDDKGWIGIGGRLALGATYCAAYWVLWHASFTQWFLPAGLRVAALLFLPYRLWPYLFFGDAAALLMMRVPKAEEYSTAWAYLSPIILMPSIAIVVALIRNRIKGIQDHAKWLPLNALLIAVSGSISNMAVNYFLSGPALTVGFLKDY